MTVPQSEAILQALKDALSSSNLRYVDVAEKLGVSLPTVKRMLSKPEIPLNRLLELCALCNLSLDDLVKSARKQEPKHTIFTDEQDRLFFDYPGAYLFFRYLVDGEKVAEIQRKHRLSLKSVRKYLRLLEEHKLIELWPGDKVKVLLKSPMGFGPESLVLSKIIREKMDYLLRMTVPKIEAGCYHIVKPLLLHPREYRRMLEDCQAIFDRYSALSKSNREVQPEFREYLMSLLAAPAPNETKEHRIPELD